MVSLRHGWPQPKDRTRKRDSTAQRLRALKRFQRAKLRHDIARIAAAVEILARQGVTL